MSVKCPFCDTANGDECEDDGMWHCKRCRWAVDPSSWPSLRDAISLQTWARSETRARTVHPEVERWVREIRREERSQERKKQRSRGIRVGRPPTAYPLVSEQEAERDSLTARRQYIAGEPWLRETRPAPERRVRSTCAVLGYSRMRYLTSVITGDDHYSRSNALIPREAWRHVAA